MRVITLNANGIRSAARRGFFEWAQTEDANVICLQETRAREHQLLLPEAPATTGLTAYFVDAKRRGYSGVALYSRQEPLSIRRTLGWDDRMRRDASCRPTSERSPFLRFTFLPASPDRRGKPSRWHFSSVCWLYSAASPFGKAADRLRRLQHRAPNNRYVQPGPQQSCQRFSPRRACLDRRPDQSGWLG